MQLWYEQSWMIGKQVNYGTWELKKKQQARGLEKNIENFPWRVRNLDARRM